MATVKVIALEKHGYGVGDRNVGDEYDCEEAHVQALELLGKVKRKVVDEPAKPATPRKLDAKPAADAPKHKAQYERRDIDQGKKDK